MPGYGERIGGGQRCVGCRVRAGPVCPECLDLVAKGVSARRSMIPAVLGSVLAAGLWALAIYGWLDSWNGVVGTIGYRASSLFVMFAFTLSAFAVDEFRRPRLFELSGAELVVTWPLGRHRRFPAIGLESRFGTVNCLPSGERYKVGGLRHTGADDLHRGVRVIRELTATGV